jgi:hypothetical protein
MRFAIVTLFLAPLLALATPTEQTSQNTLDFIDEKCRRDAGGHWRHESRECRGMSKHN